MAKTFEEWCEQMHESHPGVYDGWSMGVAKAAWLAGQAAQRERDVGVVLLGRLSNDIDCGTLGLIAKTILADTGDGS